MFNTFVISASLRLLLLLCFIVFMELLLLFSQKCIVVLVVYVIVILQYSIYSFVKYFYSHVAEILGCCLRLLFYIEYYS